MVTVNTSASAALAVLQFLTPRTGTDSVARTPAQAAAPASARPRLSAGFFDALTKISETARAAAKLADLPPEHADKLKSFGADTAIRTAKPVMNDAEFQSTVMSHISESWTGLEGFDAALANGTVKIARAADVAGLGYETIQYDMFKNGSQIGSAGWDTIDRSFYDAQTAKGVRQGIGSINGQDYYVTW
jgi:hypothetical protein